MATVRLKNCTLSKKQVQYIRENHKRMTIGEMARNLNLNFMKVGRNMQVLGLSTPRRAPQRTKVVEFSRNGFFNVDDYAQMAII